MNLLIAGRPFQLKANSADMEQSMRQAADDINRMLDRYTAKYPDKDLVEILLFVTLTQTVYKYDAIKKCNQLTAEGAKLAGDLSEYLKMAGLPDRKPDTDRSPNLTEIIFCYGLTVFHTASAC